MAGKKTLLTIIIFAFITRLLLLLFFPLQYTDYYLINTAAQNLIDGHGMGFYRSATEDLSQYYFEGLRLWPPLVPFITAVFLKLSGSIPITDFIISTVLLITLFIYLNKLFKLLNLSVPFQVVGYLFVAINPDLIKQPGFSDLAASTFCIAACVYCSSIVTTKTKNNYLTLLVYAFAFFLPSALRYQFYPVTIFFPFAILVSGFCLKDKKIKKQALILLAFVGMLIMSQELFLLKYTSQPLTQSVSMDNRGFFLSNLTFIYPFFLKTFVNLSYIENKFPYVIKHLGQFYSLGILTLFFVWFYKIFNLTKRTKYAPDPSIEIRNYLSVRILLFVSLLPVCILTLLSVIYNSRTGLPGGWTYVKEGRYYIISSILILILSLWYIQNKLKVFSSFVKKTVAIFFAIILIYNSVLTFKFYYNVHTNNIPDKEVYNRADRQKIDSVLTVLSKNGVTTIISSDEPYFSYFPFKENVAIAQKPSMLISKQIHSSKKIQILIVAPKPLTGADSILVSKTFAKQIASLHTSHLFLATMMPTTNK